jgi:hypothetical protein
MNRLPYRHFSIFFFILLLSNCKGQTTDTLQIWKSEHYDLNAEFNSKWSLLPSTDTPKKILFGVIDKSDGKSYILKIVDDVSQEQLNDSSYYQLTKNQMLGANEKNILINESDTIVHGKKFHLQVFLMNTLKWGILKQYGYIYRDGIKMISIQLSFPIEEKNANQETIPQMLIEFDKGLKINDL